MANRNMKADMNVQFTEASSRQSIESGESVKTLFGKIRKWLSDLKPVAFSGSYNDLSNKPTTGVSGVKGNSETTYRTGNVNLTPANIGLGNVNNTSDANKPISTAAQAALDSQQEQIDYNTNQGVKNQLITDSKSGTATIYGITIKSNNDGTFTINGTNSNLGSTMFAPNLSDLNLLGATTQITPKTLKSNKVKFYAIGLPSTVQLQLAKSTSVSVAGITLNGVKGSAVSDVVDITNYGYVWFRLVADANASFNNVVIKPMVVDASVIDTSDFVPYAEPNYQLTQKVDRALEQTGCNLLEITASTQTINGVTFTVDKAAGTITANGTLTAATWFTLCNASLPAGNYALNGCPSGGSLGTYSLVLYYDGSSHQAVDTGEGSTFLTGATEARLVIRLASGTTLSNLVFKPMIVPAELAGVPFQPYAKSNAELTSGKLDVTGNESIPYDDLPDYFGLRTAHPSNYDTTLFIKMKSGFLPKDTFLLLGNDDNMLYFGIEKDNFVVQTKDANSYYEFKDDGIYLNGTNVLTGEFRGKDLTNVYTIDQMYSMIHSGKFDDLFLGDYFTKSMTTDIYTRFTGTSFASGTVYYEMGGTITNRTWTATTDTTPQTGKIYATKTTKTENVTLMFAAFDYYYNVGDTALTTHHAVLIPRGYGFATTAKMNSSNTTVGSYFNSDMHQIVLPCYAKALKTVLNNHLLAHRTILPNAINASTPSMAGAGMTGASNAWAWETVELQLMSEPQIYGTTVWSSSAYDVGADYKKLPVFDFINGVQYGRTDCWLRSVVSSSNFAHCHNHGYADSLGASGSRYVRPLILFG